MFSKNMNTKLKVLLLLLLRIFNIDSSTSTTTSIMTDSDKIQVHDEALPLPFRRDKIVLLGDSITQMSFSAELSGWGTHLADVYQRRCDVFNRGMSGYNTNWYLKYLESDQGKYDVFDSMTSGAGSGGIYNNNGNENDGISDVKLVTIFFGANDASCSKLNPRHHVPIPTFESNLEKIVNLCKLNYGEKVRIVFITPPPVHHQSRLEFQIKRWGKDKATGELERNMELSSQYASSVMKVAKKMNYPSLNIWQMMQDATRIDGDNENDNANSSDGGDNERWSKYLSDGLHLSAEGNLFVGRSLNDLIAKEFPEIAVVPCEHTGYTGNSSSKGGEALGSEKGVGPWHDEINHLDAARAFADHSLCHDRGNGDGSVSKKRKV